MKSIGSKNTTLPSNSNPPSQSFLQLSGAENSEPQLLIHDLMEALAITDEDESVGSAPGATAAGKSLT